MTTTGVLDAILDSKRAEVWRLKSVPSYVRVPDGPRGQTVATLRRGTGASEPLRLLAEHKRKSPSAGAMSTKLSAGERAVRYARAGAVMLSVLTDASFFGGSWDDVVETRLALERVGLDTPVLAKEFVIDERQLAEAAACGADAVLLIARIVDPERLAKLTRAALDLRLEPLVEVVTHDELDAALAAGARVIGVNARDLDTLTMDPERAARVLAAIPETCVAVHLSGLKTPNDVAAVARSRADAALVGEALMREDDPTPLLGAMVDAARQARAPG